jgi:hypothetical protein
VYFHSRCRAWLHRKQTTYPVQHDAQPQSFRRWSGVNRPELSSWPDRPQVQPATKPVGS